MKVLCIGNATYNISATFKEFPHENTKYMIDSASFCGGGSGASAAYLLGKWGMDVAFHGNVGDDKYGERIIEELISVNVNTEYVHKIEKDTPVNFVIVNESTGSRTLFDVKNGEQILESISYNFAPDIILVDGNYYEASKTAFLMYPHAIKVLDAGRVNDNLLELCKMCDYLVCSRGFAETVTKIRIDYNDLSSLSKVYNALEKIYPANIIITLESKGCMYKDKKEIKLVNGYNVKEVDRTGAGDIFRGAFVYCLSNKFSLEKSLKISNITAGLSTTKIGTKDSIYPVEEVLNIYGKNS